MEFKPIKIVINKSMQKIKEEPTMDSVLKELQSLQKKVTNLIRYFKLIVRYSCVNLPGIFVLMNQVFLNKHQVILN